MNQKTIKDIVSVSGFGIHTGVKTTITLKPAKENEGIYFIRTDLQEKPVIKADVDNVFSTDRSTNLKEGNAEIKTVEHLLAAAAGLEIDNLIIESDNIEIPILDGSAKNFTEIILKAGVKQLKAKSKVFEIKRKISFIDKETGTQLIATPHEKYQVSVEISYESTNLKKQEAIINSISEFNKEISTSRTFCFFDELETLIEKDLIKGGDLNNAIVIIDKKIEKERIKKISKLFNKDNISINKEDGTLNNLQLRYKNEPARHKLLDVIGDLSLLGAKIKGKIHAVKPGHKNNTKFAKYLKNIMQEELKEKRTNN